MPVRLVVGLILLSVVWDVLPAAEPVEGGYAVVVSKATQNDPDWNQVVLALAAKHQAQVVVYDGTVSEARPPLQKIFPRYACFVAKPEEANREFVAMVHRLTRHIDDDPYADCFWGIVTGYDAAAALRIAKHAQPLTVRKVAAGTELAMDMVEAGVWYCELNKGKIVRKEKGGDAKTLKGPDDTTQALVDALNVERAAMFVTSGHATERDWMIGFRYRNGSFRHEQGRLFGLDTQGKRFPIDSPNPKIYLPVGNCLMGHIDRADCMATAWMNSAGVMQMFGYTVPTWYGYMGWGVLDYFLEQPGRYTLTEAFFANHHALTQRLATCFPEMLEAATDANGRTAARPTLSAAAKEAGLTFNDARGLAFDRDVVAFYGDPAWQATMVDRPRAFEQKLSRQGRQHVFEITPNRGADSFKPINTNGSQRGGRPFVAFLPHRIRDAKVVEGAELRPLITDDFILVPNPRQCEPGRKYRVVFEAAQRR
jgi:zinc protease